MLGPMVYGISFCPKSKDKLLKDLGCADSKQLTEVQREEIFTKLNSAEFAENIGWATEIISPNEISNSMFRRTKHSLNEVSMESAIGLIKKAIEMDVNITEVYVDTGKRFFLIAVRVFYIRFFLFNSWTTRKVSSKAQANLP